MIATAFILGLLGSFHCVGMCGPIAFLLPLDRQSNSKNSYSLLCIIWVGCLLTHSWVCYLVYLEKSLSLWFPNNNYLSPLVFWWFWLWYCHSAFCRKFKLQLPLYSLIGKVKSSLGAQLKKRTPDTFLPLGFEWILALRIGIHGHFGAVATGELFNGTLYMLALDLEPYL